MEQKIIYEKVSQIFNGFIDFLTENENFSLSVSPIVSPIDNSIRRWEMSCCPIENLDIKKTKPEDILNLIMKSSIFAIEVHKNKVILQINVMEVYFSFDEFYKTIQETKSLLKMWMEKNK